VASIQARPSGTYRVSFRLDGRQKSVTVASISDAQAVVRLIDRYGPADALELLAAQSTASATTPTVTEAARAHVARLTDVTDGTRHDYERIIDRALDGQPIGELPVNLVGREAVVRWHSWLRADRGLSSKTIRNHHALLSATFATAIADGHATTNPCRGVRVPQVERVSDKVFLSSGELAILTAAIPVRYQPLIITLAGTGLRWGEATALEVGDVDLDAAVPLLRITKAWKRTGTQAAVLGPPKSRAGVRTVSLPPEVVEALAPLMDGRATSDLLFTAPGGGRLRHDHFFDRVWKPTLDKLNSRQDEHGNPITPALAKRPRLHDLRHGHASALIAAGINLLEVKDRLGHESIDTTVGTYGHLVPQAMARTAAAASAYLVQAAPQIEA